MVSSCGGHFMELMQLIPAVKDHDFYLVTEKNIASTAIVEKYRHHYLVQQERKSISFLFKFVYNIIASLYFLVKENPDIIITTVLEHLIQLAKLARCSEKRLFM